MSVLRSVIIVGVCVLAALAHPATATAEAIARDIEVDGLKTVSAESVRAHIASARKAGAPVADDDAALKVLMATGLFADVKVERRQDKLRISVVEHPIVAALTIEGASAIEKKTIEAETKLKSRERYTKARVNADALRVRDLYRRQGRMATTVEPRVESRSDGRVDVAFVIKEGAVSKIDRIVFSGNRAFSERQLKDVISTSESSWLDVLKSAAYYDPERIENDRELVRRHYLNNGYPETKVTAADATLNAQGTAYTVTFTIDEGPRQLLGRPKLESNLSGVDKNALQSAIKLKAGNPYSRDAVDRSIEAMSEQLTRQGQPFARVDAQQRVDSATGRLDVVFRIEKGRPLYIERLDIVGNDRTRDHVIRRELRLAEGDAVNPFLVERARARVRALGFFKSVEMKAMPGSGPDRMQLTVAVVEQETAEFGVGAGYSTTEGLIGDISVTEKNLFGNGQQLKFKVAGSSTRLQADISFTDPHAFGSNIAAGFDLIYKDIDYTRQASYKSTRAGGALRAGTAITDELTTTVNYTFMSNTLYDVGPNASAAVREAVPGFPNASSTSYNTSSIGNTTVYDGRDNKRRPTSGVYFALTQDFAGAGGDVRYVRSTGDARAYYPVSDSVTLFGRVTGGVIGGWGGQDVRLLDLFYKGNDAVRGFAAAGIGPRDLASANLDALGGRMYATTTAEAMFDLPGVPKDLGVRGAVFVDAGSLWGTNKTAAVLPGVAGNTPSLRASAGVGLSWDSPLGPLRADYAFPLVKQPYDKVQPFSFGMSKF